MAQPRRILAIVEDHDPTRSVLAKLLARKGWEVQTAATIAEGLELLDSEPDCLVLDLMLPDGDGETVLRFARERNLRTRIVVATGTGDEDRLENLRRFNPDALLRKPINLDDICRVCGSVSIG